MLGRECAGFDLDSAMLAGLLNNIGALPLLSQLEKRRDEKLQTDEARELVSQFSPKVGVLLLTEWGFAENFIDVARRRDAYDFDPGAPADLADLVMLARLHAAAAQGTADSLPAVNAVTAYAKLDVGAASEAGTLAMLDDAAEELAGLQATLVD